MKTSISAIFQVWNDETGDRLEVGEDRDSLGLVEIRSYDCFTRRDPPAVLMEPEMAKALVPILEDWTPNGPSYLVGSAHGENLVVGEDRDGLKMAEIRWVPDPDDARWSVKELQLVFRSLVVEAEMVPPLVKALKHYLGFVAMARTWEILGPKV